MRKELFVILLLFCSAYVVKAQEDIGQAEEDHSYKPLLVKLSDDGKKYIRFITWHQIFVEDNDLGNSDQGFTMRLRRSRFLGFAQISSRFMIFTHFGINNMNSGNMNPTGNREGFSNTPQLFMHDAYGEVRVSEGDQLYIGGGLHYWNGISRMTSASTLNLMTLDSYRQGWATLGLSDQFARHLGIYAKGVLGKLRYTLSVNDPMVNSLDAPSFETFEDIPEGESAYLGRRFLGKDAGLSVQGYFDYQFFDQESNKLPFRVGTYFGKKKIFNVGAGFFNHANGTVLREAGNPNPVGQDVNHFAVDAFYDAPLGEGAINALAAFYNFDYGDDYALGQTYGTGTSYYAHVGYLFPKFSERGRFMPYVTYSSRNFDAFEEPGNTFQVGANWFLNGHHAKFTLEYTSVLNNHTGDAPDRRNGLVFQTHIFL